MQKTKERSISLSEAYVHPKSVSESPPALVSPYILDSPASPKSPSNVSVNGEIDDPLRKISSCTDEFSSTAMLKSLENDPLCLQTSRTDSSVSGFTQRTTSSGSSGSVGTLERKGSISNLPQHARQKNLNVEAFSRYLGTNCTQMSSRMIAQRLCRLGLEEGCAEMLSIAYEWSSLKIEDLANALTERGIGPRNADRIAYGVCANQDSTYRDIESSGLPVEDGECLAFAITWAIFRSRANTERDLILMGMSEKDVAELFLFIEHARTDLVQVQRIFAKEHKGDVGQRLLLIRESPRLYYDYLVRRKLTEFDARKIVFTFRMAIYSHERIVRELTSLGMDHLLADRMAFILRWLKETDESSERHGLRPFTDVGVDEQTARQVLFLNYFLSFPDPEQLLEEVFLEAGLTPPPLPQIQLTSPPLKNSRRTGISGHKDQIAKLRKHRRGCGTCAVM
mmetsp:Transcript_36905/g.59706  ORF Transcript_36905/g.59706 Transcript_36905/m.59706 type:complete len:452 (-) Transcript_36905:389-1744(-)|eukprot:CAMPEP_0184675978 /NCGR_PEP_ID=MMETSP0308-20130426/88103_1 /TAXON_ID=38269 /ORGANISM="Gloeochaete witrockiana, Strain SAG 46.84" /LENGTH=451 /DNA_ID=CAMNT_0027123775 /DNA_START=65 /DNA_END=1420 /DNA_ORIENTATION=-